MSLNPPTAHVAAASLNQTVGDWSGNRARIVSAIHEAKRRGARLLLLPELCIPGYSLGDRLLRRGTIERSWQSLKDILPETHGIVVLLGLPITHRDVLYNAVAVVADGRICGLVAKENLATGDVQYENRWYGAWAPDRQETFFASDGQQIPIGRLLFQAHGLGRFGIEICEDGWKGLRPGSTYALHGARIVLNPSASWFVLGKHRVRRDMVSQVSREDKLVYLYSSLLGCDATRLVFDGSVFVTQGGEVLEEGRRFLFRESMEMVDRVVDLDRLGQSRMEEGSWRQQVDDLEEGHFGPSPRLVDIAGDFTCEHPLPAPNPYWLEGTGRASIDPSLDWLHADGLLTRAPTETDLPYLELELALAMGLREYSKKCGIHRFVLALSGGRDSSMVAVLLHRMFHYDGVPHEEIRDRFFTAYMGTDNSGNATRTAASSLSAELGATHYEGGIQDTVDTHLSVIRGMTGIDVSWETPAHDVPLQNVQARLRGSLIWMIANLKNGLLLSTSNKSEAAVGYATMDGDTSGGLSPIADVPKSMIGQWLRWAADLHGYSAVDLVLGTPATAELRPPDQGQTDEEDLMPYDILDRLMFHFVQLGQDPLEMFKALWPALRERYEGRPEGLADHIRKFVRMLCFAQWKRERFAISFRVTAFDLDPKTGFRFPPVQAPFTEELADLARYVSDL